MGSVASQAGEWQAIGRIGQRPVDALCHHILDDFGAAIVYEANAGSGEPATHIQTEPAQDLGEIGIVIARIGELVGVAIVAVADRQRDERRNRGRVQHGEPFPFAVRSESPPATGKVSSGLRRRRGLSQRRELKLRQG